MKWSSLGGGAGLSPNNKAHKYPVTTQQLDEPNIKFTTFLLQFCLINKQINKFSELVREKEKI